MILLAIANAFWCCGSHFHLVVLDVSAAKGASAWDRLTHMSLWQFATPIKDRSSFRVLGSAIFETAFTLSHAGLIPARVIQHPS